MSSVMKKHSGNDNRNLAKAREEVNDEFYTRYEDVAEEVDRYKEQFKNKVVYCNCDGIHSNFYKYFDDNYMRLGLTCLLTSEYNKHGHGISYMLTKKRGNLGHGVGVETYVKHKLVGNGSFKSYEAVRMIMQSDIIVTNPPFSLSRDFLSLMIEHGKKFLFVSNKNLALTSDAINHFVDGRVWMGYTSPRFFRTPEGYDNPNVRTVDGERMMRFGNIGWFTNLDKKFPILHNRTRYDPELHRKYDNYDAINVNRIDQIPYDYRDIMGVPVTFLDHYNPYQYELFGMTKYGNRKLPDGFWDANSGTRTAIVDGKQMYARLFIRAKLFRPMV